MSVEYYEVPPPGYVHIDDAAEAVNRSRRTIYSWIETDGVRSFRPTSGLCLVRLDDVLKVEAFRRKGPRRKPRPPRLNLGSERA